MVISIPERTVKIYDSGSPVGGTVRLKKAAEPFARMVPYMLWLFAEEELTVSYCHLWIVLHLKLNVYRKGFHQQKTHMGTVEFIH